MRQDSFTNSLTLTLCRCKPTLEGPAHDTNFSERYLFKAGLKFRPQKPFQNKPDLSSFHNFRPLSRKSNTEEKHQYYQCYGQKHENKKRKCNNIAIFFISLSLNMDYVILIFSNYVNNIVIFFISLPLNMDYVILIFSNYVIMSFVILNSVINEILKVQNSNSRLSFSNYVIISCPFSQFANSIISLYLASHNFFIKKFVNK